MRTLTSFFMPGIFVLFSCTYKTKDKPVFSVKDSIVEKYIAFIDSSDQFDLFDRNYNILRAYYNNDTNFLKKLSEQIEDAQKSEDVWIQDSCIHQKRIRDLGADEAYRFIYSASFCDYTLNITISKKNKSRNLKLLLAYSESDINPCQIVSDYDKELTANQWDDFLKAIEKADFWGLKRENGVQVLDGDNLRVIGYLDGRSTYSGKTKFNYVSRQTSYSTLKETFKLALNLSGIKKGCVKSE